MKKIVSEHVLSLRQRPFEHWIVVAPVVALTALAANFAPWLFALIMGGALFYYFWTHRENLVLFLIIYTPLEELVLKMLPETLYAPVRFMWEGMLFAMMGLMLVERLLLSKTWKKSPIDKLLVVFVGVWFLSGVVNHVPLSTSLIHIKNLVRYIPLFYIIYNLKPAPALIKRVVTAVIVIGVIQALICIGQALEGNVLVKLFQPRDVVVDGQLIRGPDVQLGSYHTKFTGTFSRANLLGNYLAVAICFTVAAYFTLGKKRIYLLSMLPMLAALIISSSRISYISAFVAVGVILFNIRHPRRVAYFVVPILIAAILFLGAITVDASKVDEDFSILARFYYLFTPEVIDIMASGGRLYAILYVVPAVLLANPILGLGPGTFMQISQQMAADEVFAQADSMGLYTAALRYVHDVGYVALFVQAGLLGIASLLWIFIRLYKRAKAVLTTATDPLIRVFLLGSLGSLVALAIQNLACFNLTYRNQSLVVWVICGLIALFSIRATETIITNGEKR